MKRRHLRLWLGIACVIAAGATRAAAEETVKKTEDVLSSVAGIARNLELADVPSPIDVTADRLEFDYNKGVLRYSGNVRIEHAGATIRAQQIEISFETEGKRALQKIIARGGVEVLRGKETARGEVAEYDPRAATIVLSQNARLGSGPNSLSGERVVVYLQEGRATVQGGPAAAAAEGSGAARGSAGAAPPGRVRVVIMPDSIKSKDDPKREGAGRSAEDKNP
ncbi:MAG: hypothetical protein HY899_17470 [Deltaproteobacteria bacterium]|nr:hypothetical protein [Deltaproteobacteria bacterium]